MKNEESLINEDVVIGCAASLVEELGISIRTAFFIRLFFILSSNQFFILTF